MSDPARHADPDLVSALRRTIDGRWSAVRQEARELPADLVVPPLQLTDVESQRELVAERLAELGRRGHGPRTS
jgi:hypothetical protein